MGIVSAHPARITQLMQYFRKSRIPNKLKETFSKFLLRSLCYEMVVHNCCLKLLLTSGILPYYLATAPTHLRTPSNGLLCIQCQSANIAADSWDTNKELPIWLKIWKQQGKGTNKERVTDYFKKTLKKRLSSFVIKLFLLCEFCKIGEFSGQIRSD